MTAQPAPQEDFRFGGHQTFPLRIAWLPKAALSMVEDPEMLGDTAKAVVGLGLGKNMVEALRCWADAFGVAENTSHGWRLTPEGEAVFGPKGHDRYLEDIQTLWWLHWKVSTQSQRRFFAWELMFNRWNDPIFTPSAVMAAFGREAERSDRALSEVSLRQHFDVWLRTYCPPRGGKLGEEGLDSPLAALGLIRRAGDREELGRREPAYAFDLGLKRTITQGLFTYCLTSWWEARHNGENTVPFQDVATGPGSPGRVLRMPESEVRNRLELLTQAGGSFTLRESLNQQQVRRPNAFAKHAKRLAAIYGA